MWALLQIDVIIITEYHKVTIIDLYSPVLLMISDLQEKGSNSMYL